MNKNVISKLVFVSNLITLFLNLFISKSNITQNMFQNSSNYSTCTFRIQRMTSSDLKWSARENLALINYLEQTNDRLFLKCQGMCQNETFFGLIIFTREIELSQLLASSIMSCKKQWLQWHKTFSVVFSGSPRITEVTDFYSVVTK